ncbi:GYF domain-containing protein mpd2 [Wickerhamomyces ciferrii]|uniref:GYF domain-containing protein mpd2 n=1 Tax=Wickerhamomyces ciferrii (strain ATCC 14091 / BCRC 22168 / CBS 111 / JCM 3599 / NBRC 0793 / NRRL Y-1031 F-60-10) TaxID=1206466 RepID=K0KPW1_WICCF|nr:GYF domain-containing protein mpd2 [Wickerhamomyces ciferrii]CCH45061.1 GYF domain-containing protein mpd2 [Wickerhamomyces ciferrii]
MRPTPSRGGSQEASAPSTSKTTKTWDQDQQYIPNTFSDSSFQQPQSNFATNPEPATSNSRVYTIDELLAVWSQIQEKISNGESVESYRSLQPIKELIEQIDGDRTFQGTLSKKDDPQVVEINEKLNDFSRWAKNESTTSSTNQVPTSSIPGINTSRLNDNVLTGSPFLNNSLLSAGTDQSLNSPYGNGGASVFGQPTFNNLVQPAQINWYYLDPTNNQQGPFDGISMHSWFIAGYLSLNLNIRREEEFSYYPLQQLMSSTNNQFSPFLTPLPNLAPQSASFSNSLNFDQQLPDLFNQSLSLQQPQAQTGYGNLQNGIQPNWTKQLQAQQLQASTSGRNSPWVTQPDLSQDAVSAQNFRIGGQSPFVNQSFTNQNASTSLSTAPVADTTDATTSSVPSQDEDILNQINNKVLDSVLKDESPASKEQTAPKSEVKPQQSTSRKEQSKAKDSIPSKTISSAPQVASSTTSAAAVATPVQKQAAKTSNGQQPTAEESSKAVKAEQTKSSAPKLAPWANKSVSNAPQLTLEQIQRLEAEESAKQTKAKVKQDKLLAAQLLANTEKSIKDSEAPKTILPTTSSWGTPTKASAPPAKTLLDIQREEEAAASAAAAAAAAAVSASNGSSSASTTPLKKPAAANKNSFASIATSSVPSTNAWTTVSSNRKPVVKTQAPKITSTVKPVTPEILRSVSANTAAQLQPTSQVYKTVSPRQEFLNWVRTSMKLNKGVNKDEVLQVLLMLPVGSESSEIVADTIYSNSSTMDGRRFAQDFMKRRKAVEDQSQDGLSWDEALRISAENDDDGWDFQVVGKKKKGKN